MATLKELYTTLKSLRDMNLPVDEKLLTPEEIAIVEGKE